MEDNNTSSLTSDVYFLIQRFLSAGLFSKTLKVFNEELQENNIFPKRIDWEGTEHDRTVDDMIKQFPNIRPDFLLQLCYQATKNSTHNKNIYSFLSFRPKVQNERGFQSNFHQFFNYLTRYHGVPIYDMKLSFNIVNSLRGREVSGPVSRQRGITPNLYSAMQNQRVTIGHLSAVYCLLFDHSGKYIFTGADDLLIKLWSACTGRLIATFRGASSEITDIAINSENTLLAAGSIDRIVRVWNLQSGIPIAVLTGHTGMVTSVNFCPTACWGVRYLISTSTDGSVGFWTYTYESGTKVEFRNTPIIYQEKIRPGQAQMICSSFSPGGTFLATGSADHHVRVYYMKGDEGPHRILEMEAHSDRVDSIQWAHAGLRFLSGSKDGMAIIWWFERQQWKSTHLDMSAKLQDAKNTPETDAKKLKVTMVCWNTSDEWVVTAVSDHTLKIWSASKGQLEKVLPGHSDEIYVLESHPHDNSIILSAGHDGQLIIWNIMKGEIVFRFYNTIEGQGYGAIFDAKWSPDGNRIAASDSHGHILTFGFGNGSPFLEQLPKELFFHTDYRPLVRDTNHWVLDEQTQIPPHLMPPPFLVDIDGNPYPPMLQRLVPGRELCNVEQLVPNIVIGNEGTQEVIQDIPQNHVLGLDNNEEEDDIRELGTIRVGRRNRDTERIRQSTGDWQRDPNMEWKRNVLVPSLKKSILERARQIREGLKDKEMEEYQKQLRQRPHMISINNSNNIKRKEEKKKKNSKYPTRTPRPKYQYKEEPEDDPESEYSESSGYSDWEVEEKRERPKRSRRRNPVQSVSSDHDDDDEDDDDDDDKSDTEDDDEESFASDEPSGSRDVNNSRRKGNSRKKERDRNKENLVGNKAKENHVLKNKEKANKVTKSVECHRKENNINNEVVIKIEKVDMVPQNEEPSTSAVVQRGSKLKLNEQYRPCEWLSETRPRKSPYYPQMGDEIVYFIQGHQLYLNMVEIKKLYEIIPKELPWNKMQIRDHEFCKVINIQYEIKPPRLCCLKLALLDDEGRLTGKVFTVKYHDMPDVLDFFVLKQLYHTALSRDWQPGDKFRCMIDDEWWIGHILIKSPAIDQFPDSSFMCYEIRWNNGEQERMSPWDMEPIDPDRMPEDESQSVPVLDPELTSILYKTMPADWPGDHEVITRHIVAGITKVMELAIAEPFLVPVDLNVYPSYAMVIEYPIDLSTIKARFENNFYRRLTAAQFDIRYLATNAEKFNEKHSSIVKQARIVTEICLRIVKNCIDYVDVGTIYRQLLDAYDSSNTEDEVDVTPSTSRNLRTLPNRSLNTADDWKIEALNLVDALWKCEDSIPFRAPVNPQRYPDYQTIVKNPMDLGSVKENLKNNLYNVPQEFCIDMRLIFQNSRLYNTNKRSRIYVMTVRLSAIFEEHVEKIIHNWKMAKKRTSRRLNKFSSSISDISVNNQSSSSGEQNLDNLTVDSQGDIYSDDDDTPLNILRNRQNTESDSTSQSVDNKEKLKLRRSNPESEDEYEPLIKYTNEKRIRNCNSSSSEEEEEDEDDISSSNGDQKEHNNSFNRKSLRQRPIKRKSFLYESSDSDTNSSHRKRRKRIKGSSDDSDSDSKSSRTTVNDRTFMSGVSSRGRVRKMTERAKALFGKK